MLSLSTGLSSCFRCTRGGIRCTGRYFLYVSVCNHPLLPPPGRGALLEVPTTAMQAGEGEGEETSLEGRFLSEEVTICDKHINRHNCEKTCFPAVEQQQ